MCSFWQVKLIDNFTNKKGMTSHCYRIAYRSMERSLTDEEINDLQVTFCNTIVQNPILPYHQLLKIVNCVKIVMQWKVREQVETKLKVVLR